MNIKSLTTINKLSLVDNDGAKKSIIQALVTNANHYINRELSWLTFNIRVLDLAENEDYPLLERLRFLAISDSNLDEFTMVRIAGLKGQVDIDMTQVTPDGLTAQEQLQNIKQVVSGLMHRQQEVLGHLRQQLHEKGVQICSINQLNQNDRKCIKEYFQQSLFPALTPLAVDPAHPFPFIPNQGMMLAIQLEKDKNNNALIGLLPIPSNLPRYVTLPQGKQRLRVILLEEVIELHLDQLFPGCTIKGAGLFRLLRDSDVEIKEEAEDLVRTFETLLRRRKRGNAIRIQFQQSTPEMLRQQIIEQIGVKTEDVYIISGMLGISDLEQLLDNKFRDLTFKTFTARFPNRIHNFEGDCFAAIKAKDLLVHHPYEPFSVVLRFLEQAANDPDVITIKQTLYRTSNDSPIVKCLIDAAENGKSVTAMVELKARFDEAANIRWARDLERAGVQVIYGFLTLKTHAKFSMVVRRERKGLKTYVHLGTGNYHPVTAKFYSDLSLFTCDPNLAEGVALTFNYMTSTVATEGFGRLVIAPISMRKYLIEKIENEIAYAKSGVGGFIWIKVNALVDKEIIDTLYKASNAGVIIKIIARGICCLRPQVKGLSENITVKSIVGRFLEHSRIFCFGGGKQLPSKDAHVYISSADLMPRNLNRRIEALIPILNATVKKQILKQIMWANLQDNQNSWYLKADGSYERPKVTDERFSAHEFFMTNPSYSGQGTNSLKSIKN